MCNGSSKSYLKRVSVFAENMDHLEVFPRHLGICLPSLKLFLSLFW